MKFLSAALLFCIALLVTGCGERVADVVSPKSYEKNGVKFLYPANWRVEEDENIEGIRHLSIETHGEALLMVQFFPLEAADSLAEYVKVFSQKMAEALPTGKMTGSKFTPLPAEKGYERMKELCGMKVLNQDVPHVRYFLSRDFGKRRCFVICQVAEEDLKKVEAGFKQVAESLEFQESAEQ